MYALTNDALSLGLVGLAQFLPQLLLTLVSGHVADQYDRKWICGISRLVMALTVSVLVYGDISHHINDTMIYACAIALGATRAFDMPAAQALAPNLVPPAILPSALSLISSTREAMTIAGPAIGGLIYLLGASTLFGFCVVCFLCSFLALCTIQANRHYQYRRPEKKPFSLETLFGGFRYIRSNPVILGSMSLDMFAVLLGGATALLPIVAKDILHTGPFGLGVLRAAPAIGAVLMSIYLVKRPLTSRVGKKMFAAVALFGLATVTFGLSENLYLSLVALLVLGASDMISVVVRSSLVQLETPDEMRGRVSAVNSIFIGTSNQLGEFESGVTAAWFGVVPAIVLGGVGTLGVVAVWMWLFPSLTHRDRLDSAKR